VPAPARVPGALALVRAPSVDFLSLRLNNSTLAHEASGHAPERDRPRPRRPTQLSPFSTCHGVRIRGPSAVMAIVNSKWAASEPSWE